MAKQHTHTYADILAHTLRRSIIVPGGANNESPGGPGGPGTGFCRPGGGFSGSRRSGLPLRLLPQKPPPRLQKPVPGPPGGFLTENECASTGVLSKNC